MERVLSIEVSWVNILETKFEFCQVQKDSQMKVLSIAFHEVEIETRRRGDDSVRV